MIEIEGFWWFVAALLICGAHGLYLRSWRRERLDHLAWWKKYDADAQSRHEEFMRAIGHDDVAAIGWNLGGSGHRGEA